MTLRFSKTVHVTAPTTFTLTATNPFAGVTAQTSVSVAGQPAPTITSLTATPSTLPSAAAPSLSPGRRPTPAPSRSTMASYRHRQQHVRQRHRQYHLHADGDEPQRHRHEAGRRRGGREQRSLRRRDQRLRCEPVYAGRALPADRQGDEPRAKRLERRPRRRYLWLGDPGDGRHGARRRHLAGHPPRRRDAGQRRLDGCGGSAAFTDIVLEWRRIVREHPREQHGRHPDPVGDRRADQVPRRAHPPRRRQGDDEPGRRSPEASTPRRCPAASAASSACRNAELLIQGGVLDGNNARRAAYGAGFMSAIGPSKLTLERRDLRNRDETVGIAAGNAAIVLKNGTVLRQRGRRAAAPAPQRSSWTTRTA